jgi:hypothetical protein
LVQCEGRVFSDSDPKISRALEVIVCVHAILGSANNDPVIDFSCILRLAWQEKEAK